MRLVEAFFLFLEFILINHLSSLLLYGLCFIPLRFHACDTHANSGSQKV